MPSGRTKVNQGDAGVGLVYWAAMATPILQIKDLVKAYPTARGSVRAVDGIDLTIPAGSFYGLLGPNGAGKSTTIGCVTGTHTLTSGTITVGGYDVVKEYKSARAQIGLSSQEYNINPFESTYHLLDFMGGYYGIPASKRRERIGALVEQFGLTEHVDRQFKELSGGLKRRVVLARALVHDPELLILDEPTAGVDVEQRREIWRYLQDLNGAGKSIILTSHYLEEIELLCDQVAIINQGKIVADSSKQSYLQHGHSLEEEYLAITQGTKTQTI